MVKRTVGMICESETWSFNRNGYDGVELIGVEHRGVFERVIEKERWRIRTNNEPSLRCSS